MLVIKEEQEEVVSHRDGGDGDGESEQLQNREMVNSKDECWDRVSDEFSDILHYTGVVTDEGERKGEAMDTTKSISTANQTTSLKGNLCQLNWNYKSIHKLLSKKILCRRLVRLSKTLSCWRICLENSNTARVSCSGDATWSRVIVCFIKQTAQRTKGQFKK